MIEYIFLMHYIIVSIIDNLQGKYSYIWNRKTMKSELCIQKYDW